VFSYRSAEVLLVVIVVVVTLATLVASVSRLRDLSGN